MDPQQHTLLIAMYDDMARDLLAGHFDADGNDVHLAATPGAATSKLASHAIDLVVLGDFQAAAEAPAFLRALRSGQLHIRVHPAQAVVTIGDTGEIATARAYEAGSDLHLSRDSSYLVMRAVAAAVTRRVLDSVTSRHLHIGDLHIDTAGRTVEVAGRPVNLSRLEFELVCKLASDPTRVFAKHELMNAVWGYSAPGRTRTLDSHACRLRRKLSADGGGVAYIANRWGQGYKLIDMP